MVLLGGPGQGKSTIGRLLCQLYRASMLEGADATRVAPETADEARRARAAFDAAGLPRPALNRLPIRIVLSEYADAISGGEETSVLRHLASVINRRATDPLGDAEVKVLLRRWPTIVVLDGLDEIAAPTVRASVIARIEEYLAEMAAINADTLLIVTTRPQSYGGELSPEHHDQLVLTPLEQTTALGCARRFLDVRHGAGQERALETMRRLQVAYREENTARLMATPLQVTIMALLLEQDTRVPTSRYRLFNNYYDVIYAREQNKPGPLAALLERHRADVDALHQTIALTLQRMAEEAGDANAELPVDDLHQIAHDRALAEGHPETDAHQLAGGLLAAARERLVLVVAPRCRARLRTA